MFWRERRLREGLYTDGKSVYEATYRYQDGRYVFPAGTNASMLLLFSYPYRHAHVLLLLYRNGMHLRSSLDEYLNSRSIDEAQKAKVRQQLASAPPDVVLEL
jgi:hypothetical protein